MILLIDNYDSFSYNLFQFVGTINPDIKVIRNDELTVSEIDFSKTAVEIERLIRGLNPWPSAFTHIHGKMLKIWEADVLDDEEVKAFDITKTDCGNIAYVDKNRMLISTGKGYLDVKELQLEGKKRMNIAAFLRGYKVEKGETLNG